MSRRELLLPEVQRQDLDDLRGHITRMPLTKRELRDQSPAVIEKFLLSYKHAIKNGLVTDEDAADAVRQKASQEIEENKEVDTVISLHAKTPEHTSVVDPDQVWETYRDWEQEAD